MEALISTFKKVCTFRQFFFKIRNIFSFVKILWRFEDVVINSPIPHGSGSLTGANRFS